MKDYTGNSQGYNRKNKEVLIESNDDVNDAIKVTISVTARLLTSGGSGHLNELNFNNSVSSFKLRVIVEKLAPVFGVEQV